MKLHELPDEILIMIIQFNSRNPRELLNLAHTCQRMEKLMNQRSSDSYGNIFEMIKFEISDYLRRGYLFEKLIKKPIGTIYEMVKEYLNPEKEEKSEEIKCEECRVELNSKEKLVNAYYFAKLDSKFYMFDKKVEDNIRRVVAKDPSVAFGMIFTTLSIVAQVSIGQFAKNEKNWWIPYFFGTIDVLLGSIWSFVTLYSLFKGIWVARKLNIHRFTTKFNKDAGLFVSNLSMPFFAGLFLSFFGYCVYSVKSFVYSLIGMEKSYSLELLNSINYFLSFPFYLYLGMISLSDLRRYFKSGLTGHGLKELVSSYFIPSFFGLLSYRFGLGCTSLLPLSISLMVDSLAVYSKAKKENRKPFYGYSHFALGLSLAIVGCGHLSYFTFAPLTICTAFETISFFKMRK